MSAKTTEEALDNAQVAIIQCMAYSRKIELALIIAKEDKDEAPVAMFIARESAGKMITALKGARHPALPADTYDQLEALLRRAREMHNYALGVLLAMRTASALRLGMGMPMPPTKEENP